MEISDESMKAVMDESLTFRAGDKLFAEGRYAAAQATYYEEARRMVGPLCKIPATGLGAISEAYLKLGPLKRTNLMGCCLGMAKCLRRSNQLELALAWCEEINSLHRIGYHECEEVLHDWRNWMWDIPNLSFLVSSGLCFASEIFELLGNSGAATMRRWTAHTTTISLGPRRAGHEANVETPGVGAILIRKQPRTSLRVFLDCKYGVCGRACALKPGGVTEGRQDFATFIWNSHLYVSGGRLCERGPYYRDLWTLDLAKLDAWRQLPDYPIPMDRSNIFLGWTIVVHNDTAILFNGRPSVDVFDLKTEKWGIMETTYTDTAADFAAGVTRGWPYPVWSCMDAAMQIVGDTLYVFGGSHGETRMGCNLLMALDLKTRVWRRLTGTVRVTEHGDYSCPGPRKCAASWVSPDKARIYILFGNCDRDAAYIHNDLHASDTAFAHTDFWSWGVKEQAWRQERMAGNPPCARTEMACAYNPRLEKAIVFGGYHPGLPSTLTMKGVEGQFPYTYFADTFVFDMGPSSTRIALGTSEPSWRHVRTPGFPTYRCQARLECDAATGRTYLFGGWTNSLIVPTRTKLQSRSFGDLWELRMDLPGNPYSHFSEAEFTEEVRVARVGPWQRCFSCGKAGAWKQCGGTCKGHVFFCGTACLREGWKEHKQLHQCRKA